MTLHAPITPSFAAYPIWRDRWRTFAATPFAADCAESIHAEARETGDERTMIAAQAYLDTRDDTELREVFAEDEADELIGEDAFRWECRGGEFPAHLAELTRRRVEREWGVA